MAGSHAVVLGASMAGLCAARALAAHVDRVTLLDRDALPADAAPRAGAPQGRHVHALLIRGRRELEALFPGFDAAMQAAGALDLDFLQDFASLRPNGWWRPEASGLRTLFASRPCIEGTLRTLLRAERRVTWHERGEVTGLVGKAHRVRGVSVRPRDGGPDVTILADLVVDATGRGSHAPEWLRALGTTPPDESLVDAHVAYATRWFRAPDPRPAGWWWQGIWIDPKDLERDMAGVLSPVEDGRWVVTLAGGPGCHPPTDPEGFTKALGRLRSDAIAEAVAHAEPLSPVYGNRETANRFRHYERLMTPPAGFVALGDAVCKFNPIYGQGMTSAAIAARLLGEAVATWGAADAHLPRHVFTAQARVLRDAWAMATGADFRFPETTGARPALAGLTQGYMERLFDMAGDDATVRRTVGEVIHMIRPPTALFAPRVAGRVLRRALRGGPVTSLREMPAAAPA